jgi:predicted oxidoreductase
MLLPSLAPDMGPLARSLGSMGGRKRKRWIERGRGGGEKKEVRGEWPRKRIRGIPRAKEVGVVRGVRALKIGKGGRADREFPEDPCSCADG